MSVDVIPKNLTHVESDELPIVVIGAGPVGINFCQKLVEQSGKQIILYADENYLPYNRVKLSLYLAGEISHDELYFDLSKDPVFNSGQITLQLGKQITSVNLEEKFVLDEAGIQQPFSKLVFATGAKSFVPPVKNLDVRGVYTFRDLRDADHLLARLGSTHHTVVVGGGLLGLEIAKGLSRHGTRVTVVDVNAWVLFRQLNETASKKVETFFAKQGVEIKTNLLIKEIVSDEAGRLQGFYSAGSETLFECDTLVFATGTKPEISLARECGLAHATGIIVNETLLTSNSDVYAIGDCAEYKNEIHGIVSPGYDQASVAVNHLLGKAGEYHGSDFTTVLKVAGIEVFCAGSEDELQRAGTKTFEYEDEAGNYRCIITDNNRIVYVISIGQWDEANRLAEAVTSQRRYSSLRFFKFKFSGRFYPENESSVAYWPENAIVCNCMSVTRGQLSQAILEGHHSLQELQKNTHASTVCGSCQPKILSLLEEETGGQVAKQAHPFFKGLMVFGVLAFFFSLLMVLLPEIPASNTLLSGAYDQLWLDGFNKQVTGFTLLGLSLLAMGLSIFKRYIAKLKSLFSPMRFAHTLIGLLAVAVLLLHTGNLSGEGLNQWLLIDFLAVLIIGGLMSLWLGMEHKTVTSVASKFRTLFGWGHLLAVWALPVLLTFHIISVYYF